MTARPPRLRVPIEPLHEGDRALSREASRYVARVHRLAAGDTFTAFDPERAIEADATIVSARSNGHDVTVHIGTVRPATLVAPRPVTLVQAIGKGDKMDAIVRDATELGATRIVPLITERGVVRPESPGSRVARWRRIAVEAARQSGRGDVPVIDSPLSFAEMMAELGPAPGGPSALEVEREPVRTRPSARMEYKLCLVPGAARSLGDVARDLPETAAVTVLVGPEGGFSTAEIAACDAAGFTICRVGPLVLRTETVCAAVLGALLILASRSS